MNGPVNNRLPRMNQNADKPLWWFGNSEDCRSAAAATTAREGKDWKEKRGCAAEHSD